MDVRIETRPIEKTVQRLVIELDGVEQQVLQFILEKYIYEGFTSPTALNLLQALRRLPVVDADV